MTQLLTPEERARMNWHVYVPLVDGGALCVPNGMGGVAHRYENAMDIARSLDGIQVDTVVSTMPEWERRRR